MNLNRARNHFEYPTSFQVASYFLVIMVMVAIWAVTAAIITTPAWLPGIFGTILP